MLSTEYGQAVKVLAIASKGHACYTASTMIPKDRQSRRGSGGQQGTRNKVVSTLLIQVLFFCATVDSDTPRHAGISAVASKEGWTSRPRAVASYTARIGKDTGITSSKSVESVHAWGHTM